jgi:hypothetical protein
MSEIKESKYFTIGNLTLSYEELTKLPDQVVSDITIPLPTSFKIYQGKKFIRFYGCTLSYLVNNWYIEADQQQEEIYNPVHTTIHSNMVSTSNSEGKYDDSHVTFNILYPPANLNKYNDYVGTINNFLNQKMFEIPEEMNELKFYFLDQYGQKQNILIIYHADGMYENVFQKVFFHSFQCLFKLEMELIKA